jgi:hypothetical protein
MPGRPAEAEYRLAGREGDSLGGAILGGGETPSERPASGYREGRELQ